MTNAVIELEEVANGYVIRKIRGWTIPETIVFNKLEDVITWLKDYMQKASG